MKDELIMKCFFDASAEALGAGLRHARQEDPAVYAEISDLLARGLFTPEMVTDVNAMDSTLPATAS